MKYAQSTETAIDSLFFMAAHPEKQDFSVEEIATAQKVSLSYLAKIFQQLSKAGLLRSHRGAKGGYQLGKATHEITLWDIALVFEGSSPMYECNASAKSCSLGPKCLIVNTFREAERRMQEVLQGVSLEHLVESVRKNGGHPAWVGAHEDSKPVGVGEPSAAKA
ncbi:MAG: Rrf2 family transcriptional regulator [Planctomycetota bacterium]|nr:Rrf2 family transcriptional regulator [Planctomycetota bacterium]